MKGWELLKEIAEGNIKDGTIVKEKESLKNYIYDGDTGDFIDKDNKNWYLLEQYNNLQFANCDFEIVTFITEEYIDIQKIKKINLTSAIKNEFPSNTDEYLTYKINELIQVIKQLDKELKEIKK